MPLLDLGAAIAIGLNYFTVLFLTGLGGLFSERSGIVNIGLEGLMIVGTIMGVWGSFRFGPVAGLLIGSASGLALSLAHALATVTFGVDQIVSGVVINIVAVGLARFLSQLFFGQATQSDTGVPALHHLDISIATRLPLGIGRAFQDMSPLVLVAIALVLPALFVLRRTRFGLRLRACGENPAAARTLGVRVHAYRYAGVAISGALAGLSGAFLSIEVNGVFTEGQTQGLGFIALAALILANWEPWRLLVASMLFGFAEAIPLRLADAPVISLLPEQFIRMIPYAVTIVAIAGFVGRVEPPEAAGRAYSGSAPP
jgi:general nucleoside transport system permease protein